MKASSLTRQSRVGPESVSLKFVITGCAAGDLHLLPLRFNDQSEDCTPETGHGIVIGVPADRCGVSVVVTQNAFQRVDLSIGR